MTEIIEDGSNGFIVPIRRPQLMAIKIKEFIIMRKQKKLEIIKKILQYSSKKTDLVLDPFLGSGQVAVVSKMLGRKYLGFEIVKQYYNFASKRLQKNTYRLKKK